VPSQLTKDHRALLEVIATRLATSWASIDNYTEKTLLHHSMDKTELTKMVQETIEKLLQDKLIRATPFLSFEATLLGEAIISSSFSPRDGIFIHSELSRAVQAFVLDGDMHVLYTFTPVHSTDAKINWMIFRKEMDQLNESGLRVLSFIGVKPALVNKLSIALLFLFLKSY
jgi:replicative superfamily II helicase